MSSNGSTVSARTPEERSAVEVGYFKRYEAVICVCVFIIEALLIIITNIISLLVFTSKKYRNKKSSILMTNLCVADLLVGLLGTGFQVYTVATPSLWKFHFEFHINVMLDMFTGFCSLFSLTAIALERMYATWFPIHYKFNHASNYGIVVGIVWLLAGSLACLSFLVPPHLVPQSTTNSIIAGMLCVSVVTIIFSYTSIGIKLTNQQDHSQRQVKIAKTLFLVTFLSLVSWLPFQVIIQVKYMSNNRYQIDNLYIVVTTKFLQYGNSFINTIVYYFRMPGFRSDLKNILTYHCQCCMRTQSRDNTQAEHHGNKNGESRYLQSAVTQTVFIEETKL